MKNHIMHQFNQLTKVNNHTEAAILLASYYGTKEEVDTLKRIQSSHDRRGYITQIEQSERDCISNKYYYKIKNQKPKTMEILTKHYIGHPFLSHSIIPLTGTNLPTGIQDPAEDENLPEGIDNEDFFSEAERRAEERRENQNRHDL